MLWKKDQSSRYPTKNRRWLNLAVAVVVGLAAEVMPLPGLLAAALVFPEGIHSSSPTGYIWLAFVLNFILVAVACYCALLLIGRRRTHQWPR